MADANWLKWREQIAKACDGSHHTIETIEAALASGQSQALIHDHCCFVVELVNYPEARACQIMWVAGDLNAIKAALPDVHVWARLQGCTEMLVEGQHGWLRVLAPEGYAPWSVTLRKPLHGS